MTPLLVVEIVTPERVLFILHSSYAESIRHYTRVLVRKVDLFAQIQAYILSI